MNPRWTPFSVPAIIISASFELEVADDYEVEEIVLTWASFVRTANKFLTAALGSEEISKENHLNSLPTCF